MYARAPGKQPCEHGLRCYRNNPQHFLDYDHPAEHKKFLKRPAEGAASEEPKRQAVTNLGDEVIDLDALPDIDTLEASLCEAMGCKLAQAREALARAGGDANLAADFLGDQALARQCAAQERGLAAGGSLTGTRLDADAELGRRLQEEEEASDEELARRLQQQQQDAQKPPSLASKPRWAEVHMRAHHEAAGRYVQRSAPPRRTFDCSKEPLFLNKLNQDAAGRAAVSMADLAAAASGLRSVAAPQEIEIDDVLWWPPFVRHAFLASFGVDYKFLARLLAGAPATAKAGGVVVVDNHPDHSTGSDTTSHTPWE
eukprot:4328159-Prymnesium_polylepis.1